MDGSTRPRPPRSPNRPPRSRQPRGRERRERILRATLATIGQGGVSAVTHRSVAEAAAVPLGSITYYFASKDDLLGQALVLFVNEEVERLERLGASMLGLQLAPAEIAARFAAELEHPDAGDVPAVAQLELYLEAARNPRLRDPAQACFAAYERVAEIGLRAAGVADPARHAALFVALSDGLTLRRRATPGAAQPDLAQALLDVLDGVAATAQAATHRR